MGTPKLNKRLLRKVRNRIAKIPESYDQAAMFVEGSDTSPCGAVACLVGEILICSKPSIAAGIKFAMNLDEPWDVARELAGIPEEPNIFAWDGREWPQPFARQYQESKTKATRATVAVAYLDECLKRGKVTW